MTNDCYNQICSALKARGDWETKQLQWYRVRHQGIRRLSKPYAGAPDMHFPLADTLIEKLKAFFVQLIYATDTIASFISKKQDQDAALTSGVASWFDYDLKQNSNFEREVMIGIDQVLQNGKQPVKVRWDANANRLDFTACDPLHVIVPKGTQEIKDADWLVHVIHVSEAEYRANKDFNQDDDFVASIKGKGSTTTDLVGENNKQRYKEMREGIGYSDDDNTIVLWEVYTRDRANNKVTIETVSPIRGWDDEPVKAAFDLPYNRGVFKNSARVPFMAFRTEIKDKGYYSERGLPEVVFQNEQLANKTWNTICTWMDYFAQPMFRQTKPGPPPTNFRTRPGSVAPDGLEPVEAPTPPALLESQLEFARATAEYRVAMPDFGSEQHIGQYARPAGKQTATWVNAVVGQSGMSNDVRARVFRLDLGELLNLAWSIRIQYCEGELTYILNDELMTLDQETLHEEYEIQPNGSPDSWNKGAQLQKAMQRMQALQGNPFIKQDELVKSVLELDDPRLVKRLYTDPGITQQDQAEQQAIECLLMTFGWPAQVHPSDDDKTHLITEAQFVQRRMMTGEQITPELARLLLQHGMAHDQALQQKKDPQFKAIQAQLAPLIQQLGVIAQSDQQNVIPMQPAASQGSPLPGSNVSPPAGGQQAAPSSKDPQGNAAKLLNAFAALSKSNPGTIGVAQINAALQEAGYPLIQAPPIQQPMPATAIQ